jgi:hypothetical protein
VLTEYVNPSLPGGVGVPGDAILADGVVDSFTDVAEVAAVVT